MEHAGVERRRVADVTQLLHHILLLIGAAHVHRLDQDSARHDPLAALVELDVEREGAGGKQPDLLEGLDEVRLVVDSDVQVVLVAGHVAEEAAEPALGVDRRADVFARLQASR